jgi:site-specific DNA recombinase
MSKYTRTKKLRIAIYKRFSSDRQNEMSNADQSAVCHRCIDPDEMEVVAEFEDRAISGASIINRPGINRLLAAASRQEFDRVLVVSTDRLGRDEEDRAAIRKRLTYHGIKIFNPAGEVSPLLDSVQAAMAAEMLRGLGPSVRQGHAGNLGRGKSAGGCAYGYEPVPGKTGELKKVDDEAAVIVRIFEDYAADMSPATIAERLTKDGVPTPRGSPESFWRASTITGSAKRGYGLLSNTIYKGVRTWNRVTMIKNPDTGRRVSRVNPKSEWREYDVPELRIVTAELWEKVQARRAQNSHASPEQHRRPVRLLSGRLKCGNCAGGMSIHGPDRKGVRIVCTAFHQAKACSNRRRYYVEEIESRVVAGLRAQLGSPAALAAYIDHYNAEMKSLDTNSGQDRKKFESEKEALEQALGRSVHLLLKGTITENEADEALPKYRQRIAELTQELSFLKAPSKVAKLQTSVVGSYLANLDRLAATVSDHMENGESGPSNAIRDLVEAVTVMPAPAGTEPELYVSGRLAALTNGEYLSGGRMVAREGLEPPTQNNSIKTTNCRYGQPRVSCVCDTGVNPFWQPHEFEFTTG